MSDKNIRVGLLAYGAIGDEHNRAVLATPGMVLTAVCDTNPERLAAALEIAPDAKTFPDATAMLDSGLIDLVVISTPPNSHYDWAKAALSRGINVVLEKPMALTADQCDELMALAASSELLLVVYQNRRYDADFVTIKSLIDAGEIGEVFHYESFVGGYSKPCSYWHSDVAVSGGAIFDWGSHFIDQILAVIPSKVQNVSGLNQKRVWDHVTNADHAQVTITFTDGVQAIFTNSDLAAARKPKYFVLGTKGAIVGNWDPAAGESVADLPAILTLNNSAGVSRVVPHLSVEPFSFHASLVDYLTNATAMSVTATQSRDVVAIMQAAEESALVNGSPVTPVLIRT
ncbi:MAG: Gfo/Idh/MocA family oxidoreductase [Candidatus Nanopelagicales bacterium]|nr:Gfo/Idh/MocA family oxidoreductase [Candidatus Nanopelagicales bacterium]MDP4666838.1 Gfo/Idh/MocA family oxidoreductase [Candidatus Nanopelagicales bacterium]MDP4895808.1 Gfo/Idh/MocA family oxidoreductase [Candidatus Nanopelagicales bacterium]MDP5050311.1 Gfo/Idh/MocA family oxidoreductase [Candidatus Nanopelagicales bacterium]